MTCKIKDRCPFDTKSIILEKMLGKDYFFNEKTLKEWILETIRQFKIVNAHTNCLDTALRDRFIEAFNALQYVRDDIQFTSHPQTDESYKKLKDRRYKELRELGGANLERWAR